MMLVSPWLWRLVGILALLPALLSIFIGDSIGNGDYAALILMCSLMSFPVICFLSASSSRKLYDQGRFSQANSVALLPFVNVLFGSAAYAWIMLMQGGKFNG